MKFNIERAGCYGRGFSNPNPDGGFLQNFTRWIDATCDPIPDPKIRGGANWYIIDDKQSIPTDPYIVISNHQDVTSNPNRYDEPHSILKFWIPTATPSYVYINGYMSYLDNTGYGTWSLIKLPTVDEGSFAYDFRGGPEFLAISTRIGSEWKSFVFGTWEPEPILIEASSKVGVLKNPIGTGTDQTVEFNSSTQASYFDEGKYYYLYDSSNSHFCINYVRITNKFAELDSTRATIDISRYDFPAGSVMAPYPHPFFTLGAVNWMTSNALSALPYCSYKSTSTSWERIIATSVYDGVKYVLDFPAGVIEKLNPADDGTYAVMKPYISEWTDGIGYTSADMNRSYGPTKYLYVSSKVGMEKMADGRTIDSTSWIYAGTCSELNVNSSYYGTAILMPNINIVD
jgi:hypothetical protein